MPTPARKPATTPIPVQLSATEFHEFILPHLSMPKRGPKCKLGYYRDDLFTLLVFVARIPDAIAPFFGDGVGPIAMQDAEIELVMVRQMAHTTDEGMLK